MSEKLIVCVMLLGCLATPGIAMDENLVRFLDSSISNQARAQAGQMIGFLEEEDDLEKLQTFLNDTSQVPELRAIALQKFGDSKPTDTFDSSVKLLRNRETPPQLRIASAGFIARATQFGSLEPEYRQLATQVMQEVLKKDQPEEIRAASISYLLKVGDPGAEELLRGAISTSEGIIDQEKAVGYAASSDPRKYESELSVLLDQSEKPLVKSKTIEVLESNPKYQQKIRDLFMNADSPLEVRIAAVESLTKYMPQFVEDAVLVAGDSKQPAALRSTCLYQISGAATRLANDPESWTSLGLDRNKLSIAVREIAESNSAPEQVKDAASKYLEMRNAEQ